MFRMRKKEEKREELYAAASGRLIPIEAVQDPVFLGDGFAIALSGDTIYACADAHITMLFPSHHAIGLTLKDGLELLIHVGIDTVNENGKGFTCLCKQGMDVKKGDVLLRMNRAYFDRKGYDMTVIIIFTNRTTYRDVTSEAVTDVIGGKSLVATYTI